MTTIQIFDPALCCSSGVCGVDVAQPLVQFSADAEWAGQNGIALERYNLAQQPTAFAEHAVVRQFLERSGAEALPLTLVDGAIALAGRYPQRTELARWAGIAPQPAEGTASAAGPCGCGSKTC
ncbi:MAG: arsenite efflux transporter metallochaperone ArsD [Pseudomonadota bacterium]